MKNTAVSYLALRGTQYHYVVSHTRSVCETAIPTTASIGP
jgi:hypothetical protein